MEKRKEWNNGRVTKDRLVNLIKELFNDKEHIPSEVHIEYDGEQYKIRYKWD